jgi:hypothetical protein
MTVCWNNLFIITSVHDKLSIPRFATDIYQRTRGASIFKWHSTKHGLDWSWTGPIRSAQFYFFAFVNIMSFLYFIWLYQEEISICNIFNKYIVKHFPCWYTVISTRVELGKREIVWKHDDRRAECFQGRRNDVKSRGADFRERALLNW